MHKATVFHLSILGFIPPVTYFCEPIYIADKPGILNKHNKEKWQDQLHIVKHSVRH